MHDCPDFALWYTVHSGNSARIITWASVGFLQFVVWKNTISFKLLKQETDRARNVLVLISIVQGFSFLCNILTVFTILVLVLG